MLQARHRYDETALIGRQNESDPQHQSQGGFVGGRLAMRNRHREQTSHCVPSGAILRWHNRFHHQIAPSSTSMSCLTAGKTRYRVSENASGSVPFFLSSLCGWSQPPDPRSTCVYRLRPIHVKENTWISRIASLDLNSYSSATMIESIA